MNKKPKGAMLRECLYCNKLIVDLLFDLNFKCSSSGHKQHEYVLTKANLESIRLFNPLIGFEITIFGTSIPHDVECESVISSEVNPSLIVNPSVIETDVSPIYISDDDSKSYKFEEARSESVSSLENEGEDFLNKLRFRD